jgi:hypothetical protein
MDWTMAFVRSGFFQCLDYEAPGVRAGLVDEVFPVHRGILGAPTELESHAPLDDVVYDDVVDDFLRAKDEAWAGALAGCGKTQSAGANRGI